MELVPLAIDCAAGRSLFFFFLSFFLNIFGNHEMIGFKDECSSRLSSLVADRHWMKVNELVAVDGSPNRRLSRIRPTTVGGSQKSFGMRLDGLCRVKK